MAGNLNGRLGQHFDKRGSSVVTGTSAASLNIEWVRLVRWWEHPLFADGDARHAAELVAFDVFDHALRGRDNPSKEAMDLSKGPDFRERMAALFNRPHTRELRPPRVPDLDRKVTDLTARVEAIEARLGDIER
jgi:hypothetical protein